MRRISSEMQKLELPYKREFILSLANNNYSDQTVKNYERDLLIFELFLTENNKSFEDIDKLLVTEYKGFLKTGKHHEAIDLYEKSRSLGARSEESDPATRGNAIGTGSGRKSSSRVSRRRPNSKSGLAAKSINRMLSSLRAFLTFLVDIDQKVPIPPTAIKMIKAEKRESQVADFEELVRLIEAPDNFETKRAIKYRNRAILELLFSTGMRISELTSLDRDQVSLSSEDGYVNPRIYIMGKGKKQRFVYLTERCVYFLKRYLISREDDYPAVFIPYRGERRTSLDPDMVRISPNYVQNMMKRYRLRLGIVIPTTPHSLRHGFATYLAEQGANPAAIQRLLGHESLQTTTRYVHSSDKFAAKAHRKYHPLKNKSN